MQQLDLFDKTPEFFLYGELEKVKTSMDRQRRAIFSILSEMQEQILQLKEKGEKKIHGNVM